jgi:hypothetical protein
MSQRVGDYESILMGLSRIQRDKRLREKSRINSEIVETDVEVVSLVSKSRGKCGNQGGIRTMDYDPCRLAMKDKKYIADIQRNGMARLKFNGKNLGLTLEKGEYQRVSDYEKSSVVDEVKFGDPLKNKKWIMYGLIAVAGYFAYKKFKK